MKVLDILFGPTRSLRRGLVLNIIISLSLCIVLSGAVMIHEFYEHLEQDLYEDLFQEAKEVVGQIDPDLPEYGLNGDALRFRGVEGIFRYTLFDGAGEVIVGGETSSKILSQIQSTILGTPKSIDVTGDRIGVGLRARIKDQDVVALVSTYPAGNEETQLQKMLHEVEDQIVWAFIGTFVVLLVAIITTRRALMPLDRLSQQAAQISPTDADHRLETVNVPAEITPLISAVNSAFDRLEAGYQAQRDFSSNVAHEIRTPLAVLRSTIDRIDDLEVRESLGQDAAQLDQMFQQLIDLARADAVLKSSFVPVDLHDLAVGIARDMAQDALRGGHTLSISGADHAVVLGNPGLLGIALRNVIRNALQYTPKGSDVDIKILDAPAGWSVSDQGPGVPDALKPKLFERFNRGTRANQNSKGSGIGLAIVKSVAKSHDATVSVQDRAQKGSVFSFVFNA